MVFLRLLLLLVVVGCLPTTVTVAKTTVPAPTPPPPTDPPVAPEPDQSGSVDHDQENCNDRTFLLSESKHLLFDYDVSAEDLRHLKILCREEYVICYSTRQKMALFAVEQLKDDALKNKKTYGHRPKVWQDCELDENYLSVLKDYGKSGFTRGHLVPQGDMTCEISRLQTFRMSNIYPQYKIHNNHVWNSWENYIRNKAKAKKNLLVITGITKGDEFEDTGVSIPKEWYKVLVWCENKELQAEYIISSHENEFKPKTDWCSKEKGLKTKFTHLADKKYEVKYEAKHCESVEEVEDVMKQTTKINFKISSSLTCDENNGQLVEKLSSSTDESKPNRRVFRYCHPDIPKPADHNRISASGSNCRDRQCVV